MAKYAVQNGLRDMIRVMTTDDDRVGRWGLIKLNKAHECAICGCAMGQGEQAYYEMFVNWRNTDRICVTCGNTVIDHA